jgi:hypothetical protein
MSMDGGKLYGMLVITQITILHVQLAIVKISAQDIVTAIFKNWDAYGNMNTNTIGQRQSSGVDIHGSNNKVTVNQGQTGSDSSGEAILPRCVVLCGYVNNH